MENQNDWLTHYFYAYTVGPLSGGLLAGFCYRLFVSCLSAPENPNDLENHLADHDQNSEDGKRGGYRGVVHDESNS